MKCNPWFGTGLTLLVALNVLVDSAGASDEAQAAAGSVTVEVASGRIFSGVVDPRSDDERLWLATRAGGIVTRRPIRWERIGRAEAEDGPLRVEDLRDRVVARAADRATPSDETVPRVVVRGSHGVAGTFRPVAAQAGAARADEPRHGEPRPPVALLQIDARAANWDGDVEADGLIVRIRPQDGSGRVVSVHGTVEFTLVGWRSDRVTSGPRPLRLGRWTCPIEPSEPGASAIECRLPFPSVHPEFDLRWAPYAALHARLNVPGQGVFESTQTDVRIRPYSAFRDRLVESSGRRFFQPEGTSAARFFH